MQDGQNAGKEVVQHEADEVKGVGDWKSFWQDCMIQANEAAMEHTWLEDLSDDESEEEDEGEGREKMEGVEGGQEWKEGDGGKPMAMESLLGFMCRGELPKT